MYFLITGYENQANSNKRPEVRDKHIARMTMLSEEGRVLCAGPIFQDEQQTRFNGSIMIIDFPSLNDAENWAKEEPYLRAQVYTHIDVQPFKQVF